MKKILITLSAATMMLACNKSNNNNVTANTPAANHPSVSAHKPLIQYAYYDSVLHTINTEELAPKAAATIIASNKNLNTIYVVENANDSDLFIPVIDAVHHDGWNPLWREVEITFKAGVTPYQFQEDNDVLAAAAAGTITLDTTMEVYRCPITGQNP